MMATIIRWLFVHVVLATAQREADAAGVALFSERNALNVRKRFISVVMKWLAGIQSTKWAKQVKSDDQAAWFFQIFMKSDTIGSYLGESTIEEAERLVEDAQVGLNSMPADAGIPARQASEKLTRVMAILTAKSGFEPDREQT